MVVKLELEESGWYGKVINCIFFPFPAIWLDKVKKKGHRTRVGTSWSLSQVAVGTKVLLKLAAKKLLEAPLHELSRELSVLSFFFFFIMMIVNSSLKRSSYLFSGTVLCFRLGFAFLKKKFSRTYNVYFYKRFWINFLIS